MKCLIPRCMETELGAFGLCSTIHATLWEVSPEKKRAQHALMDFINAQDAFLRNMRWSEGKSLGVDLPDGPIAKVHEHTWDEWKKAAANSETMVRRCSTCQLEDYSR